MIYHNAKNGFPSAIHNEEYHPAINRISTTPEHEIRNDKVQHTVVVSHDLFGSSLALRLEDEIYVIDIKKIISDILEVEHENENLYADH